MSRHNYFEAWIDHAEDDFNNTGKLFRGSKPSVYGTCFHAQQCAEKYMKAILVHKGKSFPMTHDLVLLNNLLEQAGVFMGVPEDTLDTLSAYAVATRYPGAAQRSKKQKKQSQFQKQFANFPAHFWD